MRIAHLDVITEHIIKSHLQRRDAGRFALALLDTGKNILRIRRDIAQIVQFEVHARCNYPAFLDLVRRIRIDFTLDFISHLQAQIQLFSQCFQCRMSRLAHRVLQFFNRIECIFQLHHLAR